MQQTFADIKHEVHVFRETEAYRNEKAFTVSAVIANGSANAFAASIVPLVFLAPDGDFEIVSIAGRAVGPVNSAGLRQTASATDFPLAGTTAGYAERGLQVRLVHVSKNGHELSEAQQKLNSAKTPAVAGQNPNLNPLGPTATTRFLDFIPVENLLTPGYGFGPYLKPFPFSYFIAKGEYLRFDMKNFDTKAGLFHRIDMALIGRRYL